MTQKRLPFIEKYRVNSFEEIKGQDLAVQEVRTFLKTFPKRKAVILNGPVGTGKTSMALALAKEHNLELFELNASDLRNRLSLEEVLKPSVEQQSLFKKGKLILMDEADGITTSDRGGLPELIALIIKTSFPIIITANDIWQRKFSPLRQKCQIINLRELPESTIKELITEVLKKENKKIQELTVNLIAKQAKGDARAALNDLQSVIEIGEQEFIEEISEREKQQDIFNILKKVFQSPADEKTPKIYDNTDLSVDEIALWVEENIPLEYKGEALAKAYNYLSKSDVYKGRIYRQQHWRFLVYQNFFLSAGISCSTKLKYNKFTKYSKPTRILKIWLSNQRNAKKKSIIMKYSRLCHLSKKKAGKEFFLLPLILSDINKKTKNLLDLDEKEEEYLTEKKGDVIIANNLNRFRV